MPTSKANSPAILPTGLDEQTPAAAESMLTARVLTSPSPSKSGGIDDSGNDTVKGGDGDDTLSGGGGNDSIDGGLGDDSVDGGIGDDHIHGGAGDDHGSGGDGNDDLDGGDGNDVLDGGSGNDTVAGGAGNDHIASGSGDDHGTGGDGSDSLDGGTGNDDLQGGTGNDSLLGGDGNDSLDGGSGTDSMAGGAGNDIYVVDSATDKVTEASGGGTDTVKAGISTSLGSYVEDVVLTGTGNINATGNGLNNRETGNSGHNQMHGGAGNDTMAGGTGNDSLDGGDGNDSLDGGSGTDSMAGGAGNDVYVVDSATDKVTEASGGGTDTVKAGISTTLGSYVEDVVLTGTGNINATGNGLNNRETGNSGHNQMHGGAGNDTMAGGTGNDSLDGGDGNDSLDGGSGTDSMAGGAGNDVYVVDSATDKVTEAASSGADRVDASISYTLGSNLEHLTLTGSGLINGTGNSVGNMITGNSASNRLTGGGGNDTFVLNSTLGSDTITDFVSGADRVRLSQAALHLGDGDTTIEGAVLATGSGGYSAQAELVVLTANITGAITAASAATVIGHASGGYAVGQQVLFAVDNGIDSALFEFHAANADAVVSAGELTQLATLSHTGATTLADYAFGS